VLPGLADNRPLFLGAGAPRGGWMANLQNAKQITVLIGCENDLPATV
jgi:hypothetical protein